MSQNLAPSTPVRVCHVFCGVEGATWMVEQLRELRRRYGYDVHAVVSAGQGGLIDKLQAENIPFHTSPFVFSITQPFQVVRATLLMRRLLLRERFDVVQSHVFWSAFLARPAAWLADVPVRLAMIAGPYHLQAFSSRWVDRSTAWMETALIPSCRKSFDLYRNMGIPARRLALIYYGADASKFDPAHTPPSGIRAEYGWHENTPVIALVAYFYTPQPKGTWTPPGLHGRGIKGQDLFIKAAALVAEEFPDAKFLLVGSDWGATDYKQMLEYLVQELGLEERVVFTGYRPDVNQILRGVDVAVQASRSENLGGTIEALLMECPLVVTRVGGMPDTVRDHETGILVNPSDPADLARGILEMLRDPRQARACGRNGRSLMIREFSLDKTVDDLHSLYARLLAANRRRPRILSWCVAAIRMAIVPFAGLYCVSGLAAIRRAADIKAKDKIERDRRKAEIELAKKKAEIERVATLKAEAEIKLAKPSADLERSVALKPNTKIKQVKPKAELKRTAALKAKAKTRSESKAELERTASPPPPPPQPLRSTLIHCNLPGDIVPPESVMRLCGGGALPQDGLYLGLGWHGLERDEHGPFRWLGSAGELIVSSPGDKERQLVLDVQSGPGRLCRPFELRLVNEGGVVVGKAIVARHRSDIEFRVRPGVDGATFQLKSPFGVPLPTDPRILNLRVRRISWRPLRQDIDALKQFNRPDDIVSDKDLRSLYSGTLPKSGILLGRGWRDLQQDEQGPFRCIDAGAELVTIGPTSRHRRILLNVEPGPSVQQFELQLADDRGTAVDRVTVSSRQDVVFLLPRTVKPGAIFRLVVPEDGLVRMRKQARTAWRLLASVASGGRTVSPESVIPNFRVRRISWAVGSERAN